MGASLLALAKSLYYNINQEPMRQCINTAIQDLLQPKKDVPNSHYLLLLKVL